MGFFSHASQTAMADAVPASKTMQTVFDETVNETERNRIARVAEYFNEPLSTLDGGEVDLLAWFDTNFPALKQIGAGPLPGSGRSFWQSKSSYAKCARSSAAGSGPPSVSLLPRRRCGGASMDGPLFWQSWKTSRKTTVPCIRGLSARFGPSRTEHGRPASTRWT